MTSIALASGGAAGLFGTSLGSKQTIGQTMTVPANDVFLRSLTFHLDVPSTLAFRAYVYAWDGGNAVASGAALFQSPSTTQAAGAGLRAVTFATNDLALSPGSTVIAFLSTSGEPGTGDGSFAGGSSDYGGGTGYALENGADPTPWTTPPSTWGVLGGFADLAFEASFVGPTATTLGSSAASSVFGQPVTLTASVTGTTTPVGTVTFREGVVTLGSAALDGLGQASFVTSSLSIGPHSIVAEYAGDSRPSTSAPFAQTITVVPTTTTASGQPNPSTVGGTFLLHATIAPTVGALVPNGGSVTFREGANTLGSATVAAGSATITAGPLPVGAHTITADYAGDATFSSSTHSFVQNVGQDAVNLTLDSSSQPSVFGAPVTFTLTVASATTGGVPTGSVTFKDGSNPLGTAALAASGANGVASVVAPALAGGSHSIIAEYSGDGNHPFATTSRIQDVSRAPSSAALAASVSPSVFGQAVTFTATVGNGGLGTVPTGTVLFKEGPTLLGSATLNGNAQALLVTSTLPVGGHTIRAEYGGDGNFAPSDGTLDHPVNRAATTTSLISSSNPSLVGLAVTLTATVSTTAPGAGTPGGIVVFSDGATNLGSATLNIAGVATLTTSSLAAGPHTITAAYQGSPSFVGSTSLPLGQTVNQSGVQVTFAASPNPSTFGGSVTFTATVAASPPASTPTGTVTFKEGVATIGTGALAAGTATFATATLGGGAHAITAEYSGDATHAGGSSGGLVQVVTPAATTTTLATSETPSTFGQPVTLTATVASAVAGARTGNVTFFDGPTSVGTAALANGTATLSPTLGAGSHSFTAVYAGDANFATSTAPAVVQQVNRSATVATLISSSNPSFIGTNVVLTATVTAVAPGGGTPVGAVTFKDGTTTLGSGTLSNAGVATFATTALAAGAHTIVAEYAGSTNHSGSTSPPLAQDVNTEAVTLAVSSTPNPSPYGTGITFRATLTGNAGMPTGSVTFKEVLGASGVSTLGSGTINGEGLATLSRSGLAAGPHTILAEYSGDMTYAVGSGGGSHVVAKASTQTALVASSTIVAAGTSATFIASVSSSAEGFTGQVEFLDGTTSIGAVALSGFRATLTTNSLSPGAHVITATYRGDVNFAASTSPSVAQTISTPAPGADAGTGADAGPRSSPTTDDGCSCDAVGHPSDAPTPLVGTGIGVGLAGLVFVRRRRRG